MSDSFCQNYQPVYFQDDSVVDLLLTKDRELLTTTVSNNQKWERFCN